jgi:hypothetical protein
MERCCTAISGVCMPAKPAACRCLTLACVTGSIKGLSIPHLQGIVVVGEQASAPQPFAAVRAAVQRLHQGSRGYVVPGHGTAQRVTWARTRMAAWGSHGDCKEIAWTRMEEGTQLDTEPEMHARHHQHGVDEGGGVHHDQLAQALRVVGR